MALAQARTRRSDRPANPAKDPSLKRVGTTPTGKRSGAKGAPQNPDKREGR